MMHILIAPNAFKNSLDAQEVAKAIEEGLKKSQFKCNTTCFPVGDGGDGTGKLIVQHLEGTNMGIQVKDPLLRNILANYGLIDNQQTAVIEMASASGLGLLKTKEYDPLHATSFGTGELIKDALAKKVKKIIIAVGGSATVDGGAGILQALGGRFLTKNGQPIENIPEGLKDLHSVDLSRLNKPIQRCELIVLCDVENKLLGKNGAAAVFGPQKGASPAMVRQLENCLIRLNAVIHDQFGKDMSLIKHGGAAGGVAATLSVLLKAKLVNGIEYFLSVTGFEKVLKTADVVITGEGSIDSQTLHGKGPFGVAQKAKQMNKTVIALGGRVPEEISAALHRYFDEVISINDQDFDLAKALKHTRQNLLRAGERIGNRLAKEKH